MPEQKIQETRNVRGENEITGLFLASVKCEVIMKILVIAYQKDLEELTFQKIKQIKRNNFETEKEVSNS